MSLELKGIFENSLNSIFLLAQTNGTWLCFKLA